MISYAIFLSDLLSITISRFIHVVANSIISFFLWLNKALHACVLIHFSRVQLFMTLQTVARQAPLSMGFSRQEYWSGLLCPPPEDLPNPELEPISLTSPALAGRVLTTSTTWEVQIMYRIALMLNIKSPFLGCSSALTRMSSLCYFQRIDSSGYWED